MEMTLEWLQPSEAVRSASVTGQVSTCQVRTPESNGRMLLGIAAVKSEEENGGGLVKHVSW